MKWFRFYSEALNDPKVQSLPGDLFKTWVNILCVASQNNGQLPASSELAYHLRRRSDYTQRDVSELAKRGLIDTEEGRAFPHNWSERQYKSDDTTERWRKWKAGKTNVGQTLEPMRTDSEYTDAEQIRSKKKVSCAVAGATRTAIEPKFQEFKRAYPKRKGANPWKPARDKFDAALKRGEDPDQIIAALKAGVGFDREKIGTEYMPTALVWLNQRRYADYQPTAPPNSPQQPPPGAPSHEELIRHYGKVGQIRNHAVPHQEPDHAEVLPRRNGLDSEGPGGEGVHDQTGNARVRRLA